MVAPPLDACDTLDMLVRTGRLVGVVAIVFAAWGCDPKAGSSGSGDDAESGDGHGHDHDVESGCAAETRDDEYTLGMEKAGTAVRVRFVDALPAPPDRGDNAWTIEVIDIATGMPLDDVSLVVEPYMPDHMHGTSIAAHVTAADVPGEYVIAPVNMFMPGLWQVHLYLSLADGSDDQVEFDFCVDP